MRQRLCRLSGRHSMMTTVSPTPHSFFSSCAWYRVRRVKNFRYFGCWTRRCTATTAVFCIELLTTVPVRVFRCACMLVLFPAFALNGSKPRDVAAYGAHFHRVLELTGGALELQTEQLLLE